LGFGLGFMVFLVNVMAIIAYRDKVGSEFRVQGSRFRVQGSGFRV